MTQIAQPDTLFNFDELHEEELEPLSYYNFEEDYSSNNCISPIMAPHIHQSKFGYSTQIFSNAAPEDGYIINTLLSTPAEAPTPLQLPDAPLYPSTTVDPPLPSFGIEPTKACALNLLSNETIPEPMQNKTKVTRNRDRRDMKNKIEINGVIYKIAYRESLLGQLHITFEDIVHAVKVKLLSMRGIIPGPDETRVVCDRIKHEVFLHDCINICKPSTRPYIHVHVNKTCTECIKKNASRSKIAKV